MTRDLTEGKPFKSILFFIIPIIIENLFQQLYIMADTIIVSRLLGVDALAAIGSVVGYNFMVTGFSLGLTSGFNAIISQRFGAKDEEGMKEAYRTSLLLSFIVVILVSIGFTVFSKGLLNLINTPQNILEEANSYITVIYSCLLLPTLYTFFSGVLRGMGDSKTPLYFMVFASFLNIILDIVAIRYLGLGVRGAALATVFAQGTSALLTFIYLSRKFPLFSMKNLRPRLGREYTGKLLGIGLPSAFQYSITAISVIIMEASLNRFGSDAVAAYSVGIKIQDIIIQFYPALGIGISTFAAQNLGARKMDRIRRGFREATLMNALYTVFAMGVFLLFSEPLAKIFITEADKGDIVIPLVSEYLVVSSFFLFFLGSIFVFRTGSQGLGSGRIPMIASILELIARALTAFTLPNLFGYMGIALCDGASWLLCGGLLPFFYLRHRKRIERELLEER